MLNRYSFS